MVELLSPAANYESAVAAINAGADALYIGGLSFGAREKAGNSIADISALACYAHQFGVRLYLTMNTIIYDSELASARELIWQAWDAGVDALIVQDMAILEMDLPPIPLHGSTQTFNLTADRVKFLEDAGFERVILERSITLEEIRRIRRETTVELEAFVHGAICVGYSGQCYLSQAVCGRSGNRGACAQPCRSRWNLIQGDAIIERDRTLLSVGDMNLSDSLAEMIDAGVTSLKIEGRLKDKSYVVNNTAHYNQKLTQLGVPRSALGQSTPKFTPNPSKSFSRSFSTYLFHERRPQESLLNTTGGEYLGVITKVGADYFELDQCNVVINNGDGISFATGGTNINTVTGRRIYPNKMDGIGQGMAIYRNLDRTFNPTSERKIDVNVEFTQNEIIAKDTEGVTAKVEYRTSEQAKNVDRAVQNIKSALSKSGNTIFRIVEIDVQSTPFMPISELNELRRRLLDKLLLARKAHYHRIERRTTISHPPLQNVSPDYRYNVSNALSRRFYEQCGANIIAPAYELERPDSRAVLLRTRHCIRREQGVCLRETGADSRPMYIENNGRRFRLEFDCKECEMTVVTDF